RRSRSRRREMVSRWLCPSGKREIITLVIDWFRMTQQPLAYLYPEFLNSNEARPIRILSEYLEPLRRFKEQKIQDTVVFFSSARVDSRDRAERALKTLKARGERNADEQYQAELNKSQKAVEWARYYEEARELARLLTVWSVSLPSENHRFVVTSGGGP